MSLLRNIATGLRFLFRRNKVNRELDEELGTYLEMEAAEKMKQGMSRKDALRAVRLERGNPEVTKEVVRSGGWEFLVDTLWQDLRFAARMLRKNPGSTIAVVIALALGIGLNTTVFSFVNALLLRPPASVKAPEQLMEVWIHNPRSSGMMSYLPLTYPDYLYYRDHNQSFEGLLAFDGDPHSIIWNRSGEGQVVLGQLVSGNFFSLLGVNAVLGRTISAEDDQAANPQPVVVLGHAFWREHLGSDPSIVGKSLMLNGANYNVIGVAPAGFAGLLVGFEPDVWAPTAMVEQITRDTGRLSNWHGHWLIAVGRLKPGAKASGAPDRDGPSRPQEKPGRNGISRNPNPCAISHLRHRVYGIADGSLWVSASYRMRQRGQFPPRARDRTNAGDGCSFCLGRRTSAPDPTNARRKHTPLLRRRIPGIDVGLLDSSPLARTETSEPTHHTETPH